MGTANPRRTEEPVPVRCAGCRRILAWTDAVHPMRNKLYCTHWCMEEAAANPTEERLDQWRVLVNSGFSPVTIGKMYGVAHSQVYTALKK